MPHVCWSVLQRTSLFANLTQMSVFKSCVSYRTQGQSKNNCLFRYKNALTIWTLHSYIVNDDLFGSKSLLIGAYYKPHELYQHSWEEFSKSLSKARKLNCNIWVPGDVNLPNMDWGHMCPSPWLQAPLILQTNHWSTKWLKSYPNCLSTNSWFQYSWSLLYNKSDFCATS